MALALILDGSQRDPSDTQCHHHRRMGVNNHHDIRSLLLDSQMQQDFRSGFVSRQLFAIEAQQNEICSGCLARTNHAVDPDAFLFRAPCSGMSQLVYDALCVQHAACPKSFYQIVFRFSIASHLFYQPRKKFLGLRSCFWLGHIHSWVLILPVKGSACVYNSP
jgi:hypothetical protein